VPGPGEYSDPRGIGKGARAAAMKGRIAGPSPKAVTGPG